MQACRGSGSIFPLAKGSSRSCERLHTRMCGAVVDTMRHGYTAHSREAADVSASATAQILIRSPARAWNEQRNTVLSVLRDNQALFGPQRLIYLGRNECDRRVYDNYNSSLLAFVACDFRERFRRLNTCIS
jgi:hypothetical protein